MKKVDPVVLKSAYASIFKGEHGKIVMNDLVEWCHMKSNAVVPGDSYMTHFNLGKQFIFQRIIQMAKLDLDRYLKQEENKG